MHQFNVEELKRLEQKSRDLGASTYLSLSAGDGLFQLRAEERALKSFLLPEPSDLLLDVGCGVGRFSLAFAPLVQRVVGLDLSKTCLEELEREASARGISNIITEQADVCQYHPEPERFDKAYAFEVFQHIPSHPERVAGVRRIHTALQPGGRFVMVVLAWNLRADGQKETIRGEGERRNYFYQFTSRELVALLHEGGFVDVETNGMIVLPRRITKRLPRALSRIESIASRLPGSRHYGSFLVAVGKKAWV